jgi:hypothetical protein
MRADDSSQSTVMAPWVLNTVEWGVFGRIGSLKVGPAVGQGKSSANWKFNAQLNALSGRSTLEPQRSGLRIEAMEGVQFVEK